MAVGESEIEQSIGLLGRREVDLEDTFSRTNSKGGSTKNSSDGTSLPSSFQEEKFDNDDVDLQQRRSIQTWQYRIIYVVLALLVLLFGIGSIITTVVSAKASSSSSTTEKGQAVNMGSCGLTVQEARTHGCVFDLMMSGWLHPACYDAELSDAFLRAGNFTFYAEREAMNLVSEAEARRGEYEFLYTNGTYHYQHCAYIFAKQVRAHKRAPLVLDNKSRSREHVEHCWTLLGRPNVTRLGMETGTKIQGSPFKLQCISGEVDLP
ncbi:hypothetical protein DL95DRAFT_415318 [Leptodontidium sp. 2 PMI_412]|nr:hypothetical protein DL95DRAFT_415318 [Leptodontidium sp. 2 PMI_412]